MGLQTQQGFPVPVPEALRTVWVVQEGEQPGLPPICVRDPTDLPTNHQQHPRGAPPEAPRGHAQAFPTEVDRHRLPTLSENGRGFQVTHMNKMQKIK